MMSDMTRHFYHVTEMNYSGVAIACGSLDVFLSALRCTATVLCMPLERVMVRGGSTYKQLALHLTARSFEPERPVYYCTILAAEACEVGGRGRIIYPYRQERVDPQVVAHACQLVMELEQCVLTFLSHDPRVSLIQPSARYRLPAAYVWEVQSSLHGTGITFEDGHWRCPQEDRLAG